MDQRNTNSFLRKKNHVKQKLHSIRKSFSSVSKITLRSKKKLVSNIHGKYFIRWNQRNKALKRIVKTLQIRLKTVKSFHTLCEILKLQLISLCVYINYLNKFLKFALFSFFSFLLLYYWWTQNVILLLCYDSAGNATHAHTLFQYWTIITM